MVCTKYDTKIKVSRSDNGREYFSKPLGTFCLENGIIQQGSYVNTQ